LRIKLFRAQHSLHEINNNDKYWEENAINIMKSIKIRVGNCNSEVRKMSDNKIKEEKKNDNNGNHNNNNNNVLYVCETW